MDTFKDFENSYNKSKESFEETHTRDLYSYLQLSDDQINRKNTVIASILEKNPFKSLFEERNDDTINQMKKYQDSLSRRIDDYTLILPTCGELNENKELIAVFRSTAKVVPGGDRSPFESGTYIVGPEGILRVKFLGGYGVPSEKNLRVSRPDEIYSTEVTVSSEINMIVGEFEKNPSEHPGDLVKAYKSIIVEQNESIVKASEE